MAPSLVTTPYKTEDLNADTASLVSPSFTPAVGEILVVKAATSDAGQTLSTPTNTGFSVGSWASRVNVGTGGSSCRAMIWTATVTASASGQITVAVASGTREHSMVVERWTGAQLAASPATGSSVADASAPFTTTVTTAQAGSVVSWVAADWNGVNPASATYADSPAQDVAATYQSGIYTAHWEYQDAPSAGPQTFGISSDTGSPSVTLAGIEIQATGGTGATATPSVLACAASFPAVTASGGSESGPNYGGSGADLGGGTGTWANPGNAAGTADATYAVWTLP